MLRFASLSAFVLGLVVIPGSLYAQGGKDDKIKFAQGGKDEKITFAPFKGSVPKHGERVRITTKGQAPISGTFVRADQNTYYVRTTPGTLPRALPKKDVDSIELGLVADGTKPAIDPEIQAIEFINGSRRTVTYSAPSLSPGEMSILQNLQDAETELARLEQARDRENQVIDNAVSLQSEQLRTIALRNHYQGLMNAYFGRMAQRTTYWSWWDPDYAVSGLNGWQSPNWGLYYSRPQPNVIEAGPPIVMPTITPVPQDSLAKARQNVLALRGQTVYEQNRLVAVVSDK